MNDRDVVAEGFDPGVQPFPACRRRSARHQPPVNLVLRIHMTAGSDQQVCTVGKVQIQRLAADPDLRGDIRHAYGPTSA